MKCEYCGKEEASVGYYENINGEKRQLMLCNNCAKNTNFINFPNMLSYFFNNQSKELYVDKSQKNVCNNCLYTFSDYLKRGTFGCPNCYNVFDDKTDSLLKKIHGKNRHNEYENLFKKVDFNISDVKTNITNEKDISKIKDVGTLKNLLTKCIKEEKYENAAEIRDRLKEIEK